ncbi:MAG: hypothetical protein H6845_02555 [Alphaproteobacteria bacterium]|nr:MAG: hypothetical protein H6845_02555 [Alphaproteobacteria bacterium]
MGNKSLCFYGKVESIHGSNFNIRIEQSMDGKPVVTKKIIRASLSGKIRRYSISITVGDTVKVEVFSRNLEEGIIIFRENKPIN